MNAVPDKEQLKAFEEDAKSPPQIPWLWALNQNGLSYRWWFWNVCRHYEITTALELGVNLARTTAVLAAAVTDVAIGIEIAPDWDWIYRTMGCLSQEHLGKLRIVEGDSIGPETVAEVERILDGRPLELLFIDSTHTEEHARAELGVYMPMMAPVALVVMDDLINHPELREVFCSIPGVHVEMNKLHMLGGIPWGGPGRSGGFGAAILEREREGVG